MPTASPDSKKQKRASVGLCQTRLELIDPCDMCSDERYLSPPKAFRRRRAIAGATTPPGRAAGGLDLRGRVEIWRGGVRCSHNELADPFGCRCLSNWPYLRFQIPLIKPDVRISSHPAFGPSDSCFRPREGARFPCAAAPGAPPGLGGAIML
jgi:hypothetical protein